MVKKDWDEILPIAEFEYNNSHHSSMGMTPFYANFGRNPYSIWPINQMEMRCPASTLFAHYLEDTHELLKSNLKKTRTEMMTHHNKLHLTKDGKETVVACYGIQHPMYKTVMKYFWILGTCYEQNSMQAKPAHSKYPGLADQHANLKACPKAITQHSTYLY
jgi:hypothetical protein